MLQLEESNFIENWLSYLDLKFDVQNFLCSIWLMWLELGLMDIGLLLCLRRRVWWYIVCKFSWMFVLEWWTGWRTHEALAISFPDVHLIRVPVFLHVISVCTPWNQWNAAMCVSETARFTWNAPVLNLYVNRFRAASLSFWLGIISLHYFTCSSMLPFHIFYFSFHLINS